MPSLLSLCLALLRLAIRTTTRVQGLLIDLHNTVEWVIERQGDPLRIRSTDEPSASRSMPLPSSTETPDIPSDHATSSGSPRSTAESVLEVLATSQSRTPPPTHTVPEQVIPLTNDMTTSAEEPLIDCKPESNTDKSNDHPPVPGNEAEFKEIEISLKWYNEEPTTEPVPSILYKEADESGDTRDAEDRSSNIAVSGAIRLSNEGSAVFKSTTCIEDDSHNLEGNESKWMEYRMMLKWYRNEPVASRLLPSENISDPKESTEVEPLDLSANSENTGDTLETEVTKPPSPVPTLLEATKEAENDNVGFTMPILPKSLCESTPIKETDASISYQSTTSNTLFTAHEVLGGIHPLSSKQDSDESTKLKANLRYENRKSEMKESSHYATESACRSQIWIPSDESESDVALEVKALPKGATKKRESRLTSDKLAYDLDLKFERNLHLKEYDTSTIRKKATSKTTKSPIRDSTTQPTKSEIESTKKTISPVRQSPSDKVKWGKFLVKTGESARSELKTNLEKSKKSPSLAVDASESLRLPQFHVDSSTGKVQWKSDVPRNTSSETKLSPYKQDKTSTVAEIDKKLSRENEPISAARFPIYGTSTKQVESGETSLVVGPLSQNLQSDTTSTSEEEVQFKPTRERRPTPPARFPVVESSTDSEKADGSLVKSPSFSEPTEMSTEYEFKPTRERRPTPAARFPTIEFSADGEEKDEDRVTFAEVDFKPTRERRLTPAAKFVDHESKTSSEDDSDNYSKSKLSSISLLREASHYQGRSPLKSQQERSPTSMVRFQVQSSPRKSDNWIDNYSESISSRNMPSGVVESGEIAFKPTRERKPTPAARFPTPESTDSERAGVNPLEPGHAPHIEASAMIEEKFKPCERRQSPAGGFPISGSPTSTTSGKDSSFKSKLSPRALSETSTSPQNRDRKSPKSKTSPTVRFQIPESQLKRENTGKFRIESKLPSRKTTNETSTSEEEGDSKITSKRGAGPAKIHFKSPRKSPKSFRFPPHKTSNEKKVETLPICEGNAFAARRSLSREISSTKKGVERESKPDGAESPCPQPHIGESSTIKVVETGSKSNTSSVLTREKNDEGYSVPGNAAQSHTEFSNNRMDGNTKESSSTLAVPSKETSVRHGVEGGSTSKGTVNPYPQPVTSESPANAETAEDTSSGTGSTSSESTSSETGAVYGSANDFAPERAADIVPQPETSEFPTSAENVDDIRAGTVSTSSESAPSETSASNGCRGNCPPEGETGHCPQPATSESPNADDTDDTRSESEQAYLVIMQSEESSTDVEVNSSPEGAEGHNLSPVYEIPANGTISDSSRAESETAYSVSFPSESSTSMEGEFVLDQEGNLSQSPVCLSPTNGEGSSESETMSLPIFRQTPTGEGEYLRPVASLAVSDLESQRNGKETGENGTESDALSSLSLPSDSSKSDEEGEICVCIKVEAISDPHLSSCYLRTTVKKVYILQSHFTPISSEPEQLATSSIVENFDTSETCDAPTSLSLISETKHMGEDAKEKDTNVYEQLKESLKMSYEAGIMAHSDENTDETILLPRAVSRSQLQFPGSDFTQNSGSLPSAEEQTAGNTSAATEKMDDTKFLDASQTQPCITEVQISATEIESIASEKELKTDTLELVETKAICNAALAPEDASRQQESASENELNKGIEDVNSQADNLSIGESVVTMEVTETRSFNEASNACDEICDIVLPKESITCQSLASDVSTGTDISLNINIQDCERHINIREAEPAEATNVQYVTHGIHSKDVDIVDSQEQISHFNENPTISESLAKEESNDADHAETYDFPISTQPTTCEVPNNADNTETDITVASEMMICDAILNEFLAKLDDRDGSDFERTPSFESEVSPSIKCVIADNDESSSDAPVEVVSTSMDKCDEVSTRTIICMTSVSEQASDGSEFSSASETYICGLSGKVDCTEVGDGSALETIASELPIMPVSFDMVRNEMITDPVVSNLNYEASSSDGSGSDSAHERAEGFCPQPETSESPTNAENIDNSAEMNSLSNSAPREPSASDGSAVKCPPEGETGHIPQPTTCEFPNPDDMDDTRSDDPVHRLDNCGTSTSDGSGSDSAPEGETDFCPQPETSESPTNAENIDDSAETNYLSKSAPREPSASDGSAVMCPPEGETGHFPQPATCESPNADHRSDNPVVSHLDNCEVTSAESAETAHSCGSFDSATGISIRAEHAEMVDCLNSDTPALSEPLICDIPTCEDAEIDSIPDNENAVISELPILDVAPNVKFESDNEHVTTHSIIADFPKCVIHTERIVDSPENSDSINCKVSTDVHYVITGSSNSKRIVNTASPIYDTSNASCVETGDDLNAEDRIASESLAIQVPQGEDCYEFKESFLPESTISGMKSSNVSEMNNGVDSQISVPSELTVYGLSDDGAKHIERDGASEFEFYIAPDPVTCAIALFQIYSSSGVESSIKVLISSETPTDSSPNTDHHENVPNSKTLDTEPDFCIKSIAAEHEADDLQDTKTALAPDSVICDTPTNPDNVDECSISRTAVDIVPMVSEEPTKEDKSTNNPDSPVLGVLEPLICEASKDECIEDFSVLESKSSTSSLVVGGSLDSKHTADNMHDTDSRVTEDDERESCINVENKVWKKKQRVKKNRKH